MTATLTQKTLSPKMLTQTGWGGWVFASLVAAGLNLALFALVPYLFNAHPEVDPEHTKAVGIEIVRLHEPEPEDPKELEPEEKKKPKESEPEPRKALPKPNPMPRHMSLPFEVNPRLPTGPQSLELPEMKTATFSSPRQDSYSEGKLDHPLTAVSRVPPRYPYRAKRMKIEGWVKIRFVVNTDGRVEQVTILDQDPEGVFERPVRRCVTKWRFEPGTVEGVEVKTVAETTIRFDLE